MMPPERETISVLGGKQLIAADGGIVERDLKTGDETFVPDASEEEILAGGIVGQGFVPKATVGRIVLFTFKKPHYGNYSTPIGQHETVPAIITRVWSDECVNLTAFPDGGQGALAQSSVPLKDETNEEFGFYFEWPQY